MNRFVLAISLLILSVSAQAQRADLKNTKGDKPTTKSVQPVHREYTYSIIKNTNDNMFLTELVDHPPLSAKVPSTAKVLEYPIGTPNKLTYTADQYRYYREL